MRLARETPLHTQWYFLAYILRVYLFYAKVEVFLQAGRALGTSKKTDAIYTRTGDKQYRQCY